MRMPRRCSALMLAARREPQRLTARRLISAGTPLFCGRPPCIVAVSREPQRPTARWLTSSDTARLCGGGRPAKKPSALAACLGRCCRSVAGVGGCPLPSASGRTDMRSPSSASASSVSLLTPQRLRSASIAAAAGLLASAGEPVSGRPSSPCRVAGGGPGLPPPTAAVAAPPPSSSVSSWVHSSSRSCRRRAVDCSSAGPG
mmetsp:Transcript_20244/g.50983  ORF Transcript_20244/g.50983 Transcript_20244/m.50983 type:complete len:201 (-) Transcript_20244:620-1222(-)